jgi:putative NIF3 family GTP cyclohydrolase 1 type 2
MMLNLNVIDPGHHVEKVMIKGVSTRLGEMCSENNFDVNIFGSEVDTNPFKFV